MNKYGLPLTADSTQTILPAMLKSGQVVGWYPIISTAFAGSETTFTLTDGVVVPITTVTIDKNYTQDKYSQQYMAAVWDTKAYVDQAPWASTDLISPNDGFSRMWSLATETWMLRYTPGAMIAALKSGVFDEGTPTVTPGGPTVTTPQTVRWKTSLSYAALNGNCLFFDLNWVAQFKASSGIDGIRIVPTVQPSGMIAKVIGIPQAIGVDSVIYDTLRILRTADVTPTGDYVFNFNVYDALGRSTAVVLTITVE